MFVIRSARARAAAGRAIVVLLGVLAATLWGGGGAACAATPQWKWGGDSQFKVYWQSTLRVANETNLFASGMLGPLRIEGRARLIGGTWGIPDGAIIIGPWGEKLEKWTVSAGMGGLSLQVGDTTVPVLSGLYLSGRSIRGAVATAGGKLGNMFGTSTSFYGMNAVTSGLMLRTHTIAGGAVELDVSRDLGVALQGMTASKDGFHLDMAGAKMWLKAGAIRTDAEIAVSHDRSEQDAGFAAIAGAHAQALGGNLSLAVQYTSPDFVTLNSAAMGRAGGMADLSASWSGSVWKGSNGAAVQLGITGGLTADNMDGSQSARMMKKSGEASLALKTGGGWLVKTKYLLAHEGSSGSPEVGRSKTNQAASLEAVVPMKLGGTAADVAAKASYTRGTDNVSGSTDALSAVSISGITTMGATSCTAGVAWSQSSKSAGLRKNDLEAKLSLSRPLIEDLLKAGLDAKATDSRSFQPGSSEATALKHSAETAVWLKYAPRPWAEATTKLKACWAWGSSDPDKVKVDSYMEGQVTMRF